MTGLFGPGGFFGGPVANLTKTIYDFSGSPYPHWQTLAWGGALLIIVAVLGWILLNRTTFGRRTVVWRTVGTLGCYLARSGPKQQR